MQLSDILGLDPSYLWDPNAFQADALSRRAAGVAILGQYGNNLAVLAEVTGLDAATLGAILSPLTDAGGLGGTGRLALSQSNSMSRGAIDSSTVYSTDAEVANLPSSLTVGLLGGVLRSLDLGGDRFSIALLVVDGRGQAPLLTEAQSAFAPGTNIVLVDGSEDAESVLLRALEGILGSALTAGRTERNGGQIVWHVPFELVQQGAIGEFIAETVADLFETPPVIPVAS